MPEVVASGTVRPGAFSFSFTATKGILAQGPLSRSSRLLTVMVAVGAGLVPALLTAEHPPRLRMCGAGGDKPLPYKPGRKDRVATRPGPRLSPSRAYRSRCRGR